MLSFVLYCTIRPGKWEGKRIYTGEKKGRFSISKIPETFYSTYSTHVGKNSRIAPNFVAKHRETFDLESGPTLHALY